jgi:peroxiredoxin
MDRPQRKLLRMQRIHAFPACLLLLACLFVSTAVSAQNDGDVNAASITGKIRQLRSLPDGERAMATKQLALDIRQLPDDAKKLELAVDLASLATEGDFGEGTLQEVAVTLAQAIQKHAVPGKNGSPAAPYVELAQLVRYEHVSVSLNDPEFTRALAKMEADDRQRQEADFTLKDLHGRQWSLKALKGKVVLLNFWATWCPPCRREMPDLEALSKQFEAQGLVILSITDDDPEKVKSYIQKQNITYPVLLDAGSKLSKQFRIYGIPKSFLYDHDGKLVSEAIDMRTRKQFLKMLESAGVRE